MIEKTDICPILCKQYSELYDFGITMDMFVYDYNSILKWVKNKPISPMTNKLIPTNIYRITFPKTIAIEDKIKQLNYALKRVNFHYTNHDCTDRWAKQLYKNYVKQKKNMSYQKYLQQNHFKNFHSTDMGYNFSFYNLQNEHIPNGQFKHSKFNSTDLRDCCFTDCDFSRCQFFDCDLRGTIFVNCRFKGEEVFFNGAKTNQNTLFKKCSIEPLGQWCDVYDPKKFLDIIICRGLLPINNDEFQVI